MVKRPNTKELKMKIVLIGHKKRQGKDTFAKMLSEEAKRQNVAAEVLSFANPLKEIVADMLNVSTETLETMKNESPRYRELLQRFGSGKMKEFFGLDVWRKMVEKEIEELALNGVKLVIIPDFRFPTEYINTAVSINVVRDESECDPHISETALDGFNYQIVVHNTGTLQDLEDAAKRVFSFVMDLEDEL